MGERDNEYQYEWDGRYCYPNSSKPLRAWLSFRSAFCKLILGAGFSPVVSISKTMYS